ncbi:MAG: type IV conjugative transfer system protein TraE [Pseudomonadota bacterium]
MMDAHYSHQQFQAVLRQRNVLVIAAGALMLLNAWVLILLGQKEERVVLVPTLERHAVVSTEFVDPTYLEQTTRDVAYLFLNRSPNNLDYFAEQLLRIVDPSSHADIKRQLTDMQKDARESQVATTFFPTNIYVDPNDLYSEVAGEMHSYVGRTRVTADLKHYGIRWSYAGLRLSLVDFWELAPGETRAAEGQ